MSASKFSVSGPATSLAFLAYTIPQKVSIGDADEGHHPPTHLLFFKTADLSIHHHIHRLVPQSLVQTPCKMRRAFQRCSASLPRTISSGPSSSVARFCISRNGELRAVSRAGAAQLRQIHESRRTRQEAATAAETAPQEAGTGSAPVPITRFEELETRDIVHRNVVQTITKKMGLETMTEVQQKTINEALSGKDIIAQAKTGTGKTLAFLLPILQNIINRDPDLARPQLGRRGPRTTADDIRALIISPTRELAEQIADEAKRLTSGTGLIIQKAVGGTQKRSHMAAIQQQGCHILVGTPGRLKDILSDPYSRVEAPDLDALVFDEADRLLDQGFWVEIQEIMRLLPTPEEKDRQTMMFSATIPQEVKSLVRQTLKPGFQFVQCVRDDEEPTTDRVLQHVVTTSGLENQLPALVEICNKQVAAAKQPGGKPFKAIVYFNSTAEVSLAAAALQNLAKANAPQTDAFGDRSAAKHPWHPARILEIHSKLTQRERTIASENFRRADSAILLSSDVTARGMDFPNVTHVIQVGIPTSREQYIHRIGRTARAGKEGEGILLLNQIESGEARNRLRDLPLKKNTSIETATLDLTKEAQVSPNAGEVLTMFQNAMRRVGIREKSAVYKAQLGVFQWFNRKTQLIEMMNNLSRYGWGMSTPPVISPMLAQRLRLNGIPGVNIGHDEPPMRRDGGGGSFGGRGGGGFDRRGGGGGFDRRGGGGFDRNGGGGRYSSRSGGGGMGSRDQGNDPFGL